MFPRAHDFIDGGFGWVVEAEDDEVAFA